MAGDWFATTGFASTEFAFDKRFPDSGLDKTFRSLYKSTSVDNNAYWLNSYSMAGAAGVEGQSSLALPC
ncbi:hypothetical protein quinque_012942 [Culex quinquefasciatus]